MSVLICVSVSESNAERLLEDGPRRDFLELARSTGGKLLYQRDARRGGGVWQKLAGPHIRQAWRAASTARPGDTVFADGEHIGIPLLAFLLLRLRRDIRVVMLGHLIARRWKAVPLLVLSRIGTRGTLIVHSVTQATKIRPYLGRAWALELVPYQVDTEYWQPPGKPESAAERPVILAVGSEHRDYSTLSEAVRGLNVSVRIAAGSHWARSVADAGAIPPNVQYITEPLPFAALREEYASAAAVVVPLEDVGNQSGVTTILEAMSMACAVVTTANAGQRECISGPLVRSDSTLDRQAVCTRGPQVFSEATARAPESDWTGFYVSPGDSAGLRAALVQLLESPQLRQEMGQAARLSACQHFTFDRYIEALSVIIKASPNRPHSAMSTEPVR